MSGRPLLTIATRLSRTGNPSIVRRSRRSAWRSSCASAARISASPRFTGGLVVKSLRAQPQAGKKPLVPLGGGISGREQLLAVEDRVGARKKAERLHLIAHALPSRGEAHVRFGHDQPRNRDGSHEIEGIDRRAAVERCTGYLHELIDRYALRMLRKRRQHLEQPSPILHRLA